jgi:PAS domain S-box-containing protein
MTEANIRINLSLPLVVFSIDDSIEELLGFTKLDFIENRVALRERFHQNDQDIADKIFSSHLDTESIVFNIRLRQKNGHICYIKATKTTHKCNGKFILDLLLQDAKSLRQGIPYQDIIDNFKSILENTDDYILLKDRNHVFTGASKTLVAITDPSEHWTDLIGQTDYDVFPEEYADAYYELEKKIFAGLNFIHQEQKTIDNKGNHGWMDNRKYPIQNDDGETIGLFGIARDITKRKFVEEENIRLQRALSQSQKLEAMGKLTGGIAHEYNNMLGIILGYSELLKDTFIDNPKLFKYASQIEHAGNRAAKLTGKLLTFSQAKTNNAKSINLNMLLQQQHHMLEKTLTISISLVYALQENLWQVWLDVGDMEDAIFNMCINAMHAMNGYGHLTLETCNKKVNQRDAASLNIIAGEYVLFSFTDTGCGFDKETKEKIFDPFFATKGQLGTGLGLSIVYGFVQDSGGVIDVNSKEGEGTQFTFYFPRYYGTHCDKQPEIQNSLESDLISNKTILIVDDEPDLLELARENMTVHGFNIFCAEDAMQALAIMEHEHIDILISDVIMLGVDGYQLAAIVKEKYPDIKIQLVSGYTDRRNTDIVFESLQRNMLCKPIDSQVLLKRIHKLLDDKK